MGGDKRQEEVMGGCKTKLNREIMLNINKIDSSSVGVNSTHRPVNNCAICRALQYIRADKH